MINKNCLPNNIFGLNFSMILKTIAMGAFLSACTSKSDSKSLASTNTTSSSSGSTSSTSSTSSSSGSTSSTSSSSGSTSSTSSTSSSSGSTSSTSSTSSSSGSTSSTSSSSGGGSVPTGGTISINTAAQYSTSLNVVLTLSATDATNMLVTENSDCSTGGSSEAYATSKNITFSAGEGSRTLYIKYTNGNGSTACINDSITIDTVQPSYVDGISFGAVPSNLSATPTVTWSTDSTDATSGLLKYQIAVFKTSDNSVVSSYSDFTKGQSVAVTLSSNTSYYVKIKSIDNAGLENIATSTSWTSYNSSTSNTNCPSNYVYVAPNASLSTAGFCIAKFEMKNNGSGGAITQASNIPYLVSRTDAISKCSAIGAGYRLITNTEWNVTGIEIYNNTSQNYDTTNEYILGAVGWYSDVLSISNEADEYNQTGGSAGSAQRRTYYLSSGQKIWDFGGNAWEWVSNDINVLNWTLIGGNFTTYGDYWIATGTQERTDLFPIAGSVGSNNIGMFVHGTANSPYNFYGFVRGSGIYSYGGGIFSSAFYLTDSTTNTDGSGDIKSGFRCVTDPIP